MKRSSKVFLQIVIVLIALTALGLLLWEPHLEGRNAHATLFEIYFKDPFLAYVYIGSIAFFGALYQMFKLVGYANDKQLFSPAAKEALRNIRRCAVTLIGFAVGGEIFIMLNTSDDRAGGVFMGLLVIVGSGVMAATAARFERLLQADSRYKSRQGNERQA